MPGNPTTNDGIRSTAVGVSQDRRVVDMRDRIFQYDPNKSPFLTILSSRVKAVKAENPIFKHLEDEPLPAWTTLAEAMDTTETAMDVAAGTGDLFKAGDLVRIPSSSLGGVGELVLVSSISTDTVTVVRNYDGDQVTGGTAASGAFVQIIGNVNEEFATAPPIKSTTEATITNYCGIVRNAFGASHTLGGSRLYGGADRPYQRMKEATQHAFLGERMFIAGKPSEKTGTNGHKQRTSGGILYWATSNVLDAGGPLAAATLEAWCEDLFRHSQAPKLVLQSRRAASQMDLLAEGRLETVPRADTYGVNVKRFVSSHGELLLHTHDMLINDDADKMIAIDLENVGKRFMNDTEGLPRDAQLRTSIEAPSADGWTDEYLSEIGLHVTLEATHGVLEGITA